MNFRFLEECSVTEEWMRDAYRKIGRSLEDAERVYLDHPRECGVILREVAEEICLIYNRHYEIGFSEGTTIEEFLCYTENDAHNAMVSRFLSVVRREQRDALTQLRVLGDECIQGEKEDLSGNAKRMMETMTETLKAMCIKINGRTDIGELRFDEALLPEPNSEGEEKMEIRLLKNNELQSAILLVKGVYEKCARSYVASPAMIQQFYEYIKIEILQRQVQAGELFVWGVLDGQILCGVGAMQSGAHMTMLYVHPMYQRRGIGTRLLACMANFAACELRARRVTMHVIPAAAAPFFYRRGYKQIQGVHAELDMVPLEYCFAPAAEAEIYQTKPVKTKTLIWMIVLFFLSATVISGGTILYYLLTL